MRNRTVLIRSVGAGNLRPGADQFLLTEIMISLHFGSIKITILKQGSTVSRAGQPDCKGGNSCGNVFPPNERFNLPCCARKGERAGVVGSPEARFERGG